MDTQSVYRRSDQRMMVMAREASVQLVYQNALLLFQFTYPPLYRLDYSDRLIMAISPGATWILLLSIQLVSIFLSAYSTFLPIINHKLLSSFRQNRNLGLGNYIIQMVQVILHLVFATGLVYLTRVINIDKNSSQYFAKTEIMNIFL